jgi:hypothetical protein
VHRFGANCCRKLAAGGRLILDTAQLSATALTPSRRPFRQLWPGMEVRQNLIGSDAGQQQ